MASEILQTKAFGLEATRRLVSPSPVHAVESKSQSEPTGPATQETDDAAQSKESAVLDQEAVQNLVQDLNERSQAINRGLQFRVNDTTERMVITVVDKDTEEIIRQIPRDVVLKLAEAFSEKGGLIEEQV